MATRKDLMTAIGVLGARTFVLGARVDSLAACADAKADARESEEWNAGYREGYRGGSSKAPFVAPKKAVEDFARGHAEGKRHGEAYAKRSDAANPDHKAAIAFDKWQDAVLRVKRAATGSPEEKSAREDVMRYKREYIAATQAGK